MAAVNELALVSVAEEASPPAAQAPGVREDTEDARSWMRDVLAQAAESAAASHAEGPREESRAQAAAPAAAAARARVVRGFAGWTRERGGWEDGSAGDLESASGGLASASVQAEMMEQIRAKVAKLSKAGRAREQVGALLELVDVQRSLVPSPPDILRNAREAYTLAQQVGGMQLQAETMLATVRAHIAMGRPEDAVQDAAHAVEQARKSLQGRREGYPEALLLLASAEAHIADSQHHKALRESENAMGRLLHSRDKDVKKQHQAAANRVFAQACLEIAPPRRAAAAARSGVNLQKDVNDFASMVSVLCICSQAHIKLGEHREALKAANDAVTVAKQYPTPGKCRVEALTSLARVHKMKKGDHALAYKKAQGALAIAKECQDKQSELLALDVLAAVCFSMQQLDEALKAAQQALVLAHSLSDTRASGSALDMVMQIHFKNSLPEKALQASLEELALAQGAKDQRWQALALERNAVAEWAMEKPDEADQKAHQALMLLREAGDETGEAMAWHRLLQVRVKHEALEDVLQDAEQALNALRELGDFFGQVNVLTITAGVYLAFGDAENALKCGWQQVAIFQDEGDMYEEDRAHTLLTIAGIHQRANQADEALQRCIDARAIFSNLQDSKGVATTLLAMASVHLSQEAGNDALEAAGEARKLFSEQSNLEGQANSLLLMAQAYLKNNQVQDAGRAAKKAVDLCIESPDAQGGVIEAQCWQTLATVHSCKLMDALNADQTPPKKVSQEFVDAAEEAVKLYRDLCSEDEFCSERLMVALPLLMQALMLTGCPSEALDAADEAIALARKLGDTENLSLAYLGLAEAHRMLGNMSQAANAGKEALKAFQEGSKTPGVKDSERLVPNMEALTKEYMWLDATAEAAPPEEPEAEEEEQEEEEPARSEAPATSVSEEQEDTALPPLDDRVRGFPLSGPVRARVLGRRGVRPFTCTSISTQGSSAHDNDAAVGDTEISTTATEVTCSEPGDALRENSQEEADSSAGQVRKTGHPSVPGRLRHTVVLVRDRGNRPADTASDSLGMMPPLIDNEATVSH